MLGNSKGGSGINWDVFCPFLKPGGFVYVKQEKQRWNKADRRKERKNPSWVLTFTDFLPQRLSRTILSLRGSLRAPRERLFCWVNHYSLPPWHPLFHSPVSSYSLGSFFFTLEWKLWSSKALYLLKKEKRGGWVAAEWETLICWIWTQIHSHRGMKHRKTAYTDNYSGSSRMKFQRASPIWKVFPFFEEMVLMTSSNVVQLVRY